MLRILGWLLFAAGLFSGLQQGIYLANCLPRCSVDILWLLQNIGWLLTGIIVIVIGELIGLAFSIEKNTYKIVEAMEKKMNFILTGILLIIIHQIIIQTMNYSGNRKTKHEMANRS